MTLNEFDIVKEKMLQHFGLAINELKDALVGSEPAAAESTSIEAFEVVFYGDGDLAPTLTPPEGFEGYKRPQNEKRNQLVEKSVREILERNPTLLDTPFIDGMREKYRTHWQQEELSDLLDLVMEGKALKEMAIILQRDMDGIRKQLWKLGYSVVNGQVSKRIEYSA